MATPPSFTAGNALTAAQMNAVGLWLITTVTVGNAVTSQNVNNCFSADFDSYRVVCTGITPTSTDSFMLMMGTGATTGHFSSMYYDRFDGAVTGTVRTNNTGKIYIALNEANVKSSSFAIDIHSPYLAAMTQTHGGYDGRGFAGWSGGLNNTNNQYTGFSLHTDGAGTMTGGTISVYGYRK